LAQQPPIPAVWQVNGGLPDRHSRKLAELGTGSRPVFTNPIHLAVKPPSRTSDRCQLIRYHFLDERIIANSLVDVDPS
jgi:hypothetical protein